MIVVLAACSPAVETAAPAAQQKPTEAPAATDIPLVATTEPVSEITIDAADFAFITNDSVSAGWVRVKLTNSGAEAHHVQFLRLNDGVTIEQFREALKQGEGPALALVKHMGGVGAIAPNGSAQAVLDLTAGNYVILCFISSPIDHTPHLAKGMIKTLTVLDSSLSTLTEPTATLTVTMKDFTFDLPESFPVGQSVIKVINEGPEPHEFNLFQLAEGKTLEDVVQFLTAPDGPPPFIAVGGLNGLEPGAAGYVEFDFKPGKYVAICNIPSPKAEGHPHFSLGMIKEFSVGETEMGMSSLVGGDKGVE
jgi:uncharacterized cupredoxin-like copper-binding protein